MKGFYISVHNGLLDPKHFIGMHGDKDSGAVWLFLWLLDKMTIINEEIGEGMVLGGRPVIFQEIQKEIPISKRTYQRWIKILRENRYIKTKRTPYGLILTVNKAKKIFGQTDNRRVVKDASLSTVRDASNYNNTLTSNITKENLKEKEREDTILKHWNEKEITIHKSMNNNCKLKLKKLLIEMTMEEILHGIDVYSSVFKDSDCFFKYKWTLEEFLGRSNGCRVFTCKTREDYLTNEGKKKLKDKNGELYDVKRNIIKYFENGKLIKVAPIDSGVPMKNLTEEELIIK